MKEKMSACGLWWKAGIMLLVVTLTLFPMKAQASVLTTALITLESSYCFSLDEGETSQIEATSDYTITYTSADETIATVDDTGLVTGVSEGSTKIKLSASGGNKSSSITISVTVNGTGSKLPAENPIYSFTTTDGETITTDSTGYDATILLFGHVNCLNTPTVIADLADSGLASASNVRIIYVDIQGNSRDEVAQFKADYGCESMYFCYDTTTDTPDNAVWEYMAMIRQNSVTLPGIVLIDGNNMVQCVYGDGVHSAEEICTALSEFMTVKIDATKISSVKNTASGVKVTWKQVEGAKGYNIYRKASKNGTYEKQYTKVGTVSDGSTLTFTDTNVESGATYSYEVTAVFDVLESEASPAASVRCLSTAKISSLTNTSKGMKVKWKSVEGVSGYYIYRRTSGGSYKNVKTITDTSTLSWTDTAVKNKNGTTYYYKVIPFYGSSKGTGTAKKTVRLTGVSVSSVKNSASKKLKVEWTKNSKASGYQIRYSTSSSFSSYKTVTVSGKSKLSRTLTSLKKGKKYYVKVRVYKTVSGTKYYSAWSSKKARTVSK